MSSRARLSFFFTAMFLFGGCGKAGKRRDEVRTWLQRTAPGRFEVESVESNATWHNYDPNRYRVEVRAAADPDLRLRFRWMANEPDGGMTGAELDSLYERARTDLAVSRELVQRLKQTGLERVTVGIHAGDGEVLVFHELTPENRLTVFERLRAAINPWPPAAGLDLRILFMEEDAYQTTYRDVIPGPEVRQQSHWRMDNIVYDFAMTWGELPSAEEMAAQLRIGLGRREAEYRRRAHALVLPYAEKHLKKPFLVEVDQLVEYEQPADALMSIRYGFPYCTHLAPTDTSCADRYAGHIYCTYDTRTRTIGAVSIEPAEE